MDKCYLKSLNEMKITCKLSLHPFTFEEKNLPEKVEY